MSYKAEVFNVMLASPSDVSEERLVAKEIILDWNNINSLMRNIVLMPLGWEYNSVPTMGDRPQEIINNQVLKNADILVGIFWTRIGTPTGKAISGTVEEIEKHIDSGKTAMLYFSNKPVIPDSIDGEQYNAVKKLKVNYQSKGLTTDFNSVEDFKTKFQRHLSLRLNQSQYLVFSSQEKYEIPSVDRAQLSQKAKELLIECSKDVSGHILKIAFMGGFAFQVNGKIVNEDYEPRTKAQWEAAINELLENNYVTSVGYEGAVFEITNKGYQFVDELIKSDNN